MLADGVTTPLLVLVLVLTSAQCLGLTPMNSETRELFSLDGLWDFRIAPTSDPHVGQREKWYLTQLKKTGEVLAMPVPSSYNDVTQDASLRDHVGVVWYQRCAFLPERYRDKSRRVLLHFGSVHYEASVWVNGKKVSKHIGGHLPFEMAVTSLLFNSPVETCVTVEVNNTLTPRTIPPGKIIRPNDTDRYPPGYVIQTLDFDFFNYAGIHRSVNFYTTPLSYIHDITVVTDFKKNEMKKRSPLIQSSYRWDNDYYSVNLGTINFTLEAKGSTISNSYFQVGLYDNQDNLLVSYIPSDTSGSIEIEEPNLWWPYLSQSEARFAYLYTLEVQLYASPSRTEVTDVYRLKVGIRSITWDKTTLYINNRPFYLRGFGRHEDANVRGRGLDLTLAVHDGYLLQWLGANGYRTSHYPYSEESLDVADRLGLVVIAETPAVGLYKFCCEVMLQRHKTVTQELVNRDKNRASVIMWSLANEPLSQQPSADLYFRNLSTLTSSLDPSRPVTIVTSQQWYNDKAVHNVDVVSVNRYPGWYNDPGHLELIDNQTVNEMTHWHTAFNKPVLLTEYGAGSLTGLHSLPSSMWTEDYQVAVLMKHFTAFDILYKEGFFLGEMVWNFADFATPQETFRPMGCMKGVLTRSRRPKMAAHVLRRRYWVLAVEHCRQTVWTLPLVNEQNSVEQDNSEDFDYPNYGNWNHRNSRKLPRNRMHEDDINCQLDTHKIKKSAINAYNTNNFESPHLFL